MKLEVENKWILNNQSDEDLKTIAKDLYNGLIFCDRQIRGNIMSNFMVLVFMGPQAPESPQHPSDNKNLEGQRDNKLYDVLQRDADQKAYEQKLLEYPIEQEYYKEYLNTIGFIYEYLDSPNRSPVSINGLPVFMSCRFLNKPDTDKMF